MGMVEIPTSPPNVMKCTVEASTNPPAVLMDAAIPEIKPYISRSHHFRCGCQLKFCLNSCIVLRDFFRLKAIKVQVNDNLRFIRRSRTKIYDLRT